MSGSWKVWAAGLGLAGALVAPAAQAGNWWVQIGVPVPGVTVVGPPPVYVAPPPAYYPPPVVYVPPRAYAPPVAYAPPPYYGPPWVVGHWDHGRGHWRRWHEHRHWDHDQDDDD